MAMIRKQVVLSAFLNLWIFRNSLMESTTSRGPSTSTPHGLREIPIGWPSPKSHGVSWSIMVGYKSLTKKPPPFSTDGFCHLLLHPKSLFVSPNLKKVVLQFTVFHPLQKKKLSFCNQTKKTICTENGSPPVLFFLSLPPLKQHESEKVLKSKPKGLCGKTTCTELVWLQSEDHPTNQVSL